MGAVAGGRTAVGPRRTDAYELTLLGGFQLRHCGQAAPATHSCERLLAFLAVNERTLPRSFISGALWADSTEAKASANLRTALWRLHDLAIVDVCGSHVALRPDVWVDVRYVRAAARSYRATGVVPEQDFIDLAHGDLLPGFWDSWLVFERERLRQELIHLYEAMCRDALERGDTHLGVLAALAGVECDPFRETSTTWLVKAHLAAGNICRAVASVRNYAALLEDELGTRPSTALTALVAVDSSSRSPR